ncbi:hypothetical protein MSMEI_3173 [Mycolicibacterium smegmatis MC2 155]|uniref:Uncharacterized protein n=1 Tax=Mycolicibacterium smegmatis (strain ATCC 700084 / mc(2)155) TaxID=246196 RepID=I7G8W8_MYCS2|nr:hypothetical protein MSMEI_3173 [Mycolicibacterium smegmatis MC2 155]
MKVADNIGRAILLINMRYGVPHRSWGKPDIPKGASTGRGRDSNGPLHQWRCRAGRSRADHLDLSGTGREHRPELGELV